MSTVSAGVTAAGETPFLIGVMAARCVLLIVMSTGCSALLVRTPKPTSQPPHDCGGRYVASVLDATIATASFGGGVYAFAMRDTSDSEHNHFDPYVFFVGPLVTSAFVFGLSALHGFVASNRCAEIDRAWIARGSPSLAPRPPPPPPPRPTIVVPPAGEIRQSSTSD